MVLLRERARRTFGFIEPFLPSPALHLDWGAGVKYLLAFTAMFGLGALFVAKVTDLAKVGSAPVASPPLEISLALIIARTASKTP